LYLVNEWVYRPADSGPTGTGRIVLAHATLAWKR
jgi:hypothetical protein